MTLSPLRKTAHRDVMFPEPVDELRGQHLYDPDELAGWKRGRDAARSLQPAGNGGRGGGQ
jgi:hypothetical protein